MDCEPGYARTGDHLCGPDGQWLLAGCRLAGEPEAVVRFGLGLEGLRVRDERYAGYEVGAALAQAL